VPRLSDNLSPSRSGIVGSFCGGWGVRVLLLAEIDLCVAQKIDFVSFRGSHD
jgi:hypothetical protein